MQSDRRRHHSVERRLESGRHGGHGARPPAQPLPDQVLLRARQYEVIGDPQRSARSGGPCQAAAAEQQCGGDTVTAKRFHGRIPPPPFSINLGTARELHEKLVICVTLVKVQRPAHAPPGPPVRWCRNPQGGSKPTTAGIRLDLMVESLFSGFADISVPELILIGAMALVASVVGGVAGYGTGALMPLVLVPIVGAEPVVPILSLSALFTNSSRTAAFLPLVDWRRAAIVLVAAVPTCALGAWGYTMLSGAGAALVIGTMLIASVPLRRLMRRRGLTLSHRGLAATAFAWGPLAGGTVGAGIILLSLLMAAGLEGAAVVATDAVVSIGIGLTKLLTFGLAGAVTAKVIAVALLIGGIAFPGAFLAKALIERLPVHVHTVILDAVVAGGGVAMIVNAFMR